MKRPFVIKKIVFILALVLIFGSFTAQASDVGEASENVQTGQEDDPEEGTNPEEGGTVPGNDDSDGGVGQTGQGQDGPEQNKLQQNTLEQNKIQQNAAGENSTGQEAVGADIPDAGAESGAADSESLAENTDYSLALTGICLIDRGLEMDVGVAYETDDPGVEFRWLQYDLDAQIWTEVDGWRQGNWITWRPEKAGTYWIYVEARTTDGKTASSVYGYYYQGIKTELSGMCILDQGVHYDVGVAYQSNDPGLMFQWKLYDLAAQEWSLLQSPISGNWISWSPKKAGDYWLHVEAIDSAGGVTTYTYGFHFGGLTLSLNGIYPVVNGQQVDMGVAYTTNDSGVMFQWKLYDLAEDKWSMISEWNTWNGASWRPEKAGDYWLYVEGRTSDGQIVTQVAGYRVSGAKITFFSTSQEPPYWPGSTIQLSGGYVDQLGEVGQTRYLVYDGNAWQELAQSSGGAVWQPGGVGNYLLCYEIYTKDGALIEQSFRGFAIEQPYLSFSGLNVQQTGNMQYVLTAGVSTNDREAQYRFLYYDIAADQWHDITGWSGSNSVTWTAPKEGYFWLHVEGMLHDGTTQTCTIGYTVQAYPMELTNMILLANNYSSATPYIMLVDRAANKVGILQGWQGAWSPIAYWDCSVGKASTPTVSGLFTIGSRGTSFDSYGVRCYWWTQFYGDYLFHSVPHYPGGGIQDGRLGIALSHGCVRLELDNAKWIYDNIPSGTTVYVY